MSLQPDPQKAVDFLEFMYPEGPWVLTALQVDPPKGKRKEAPTRTFYPGDDVAAWLRTYEGGAYNFYFSVNKPKTPCTKKANRLEIEEMCFLHVDVDPRTPGPDADKAQHNRDERERILALFSDKLPEGVPMPSAVMYSGGGYWGFWRLTEPFSIRESADRYEEAKLYNLELEVLFGADSCHNVDRIARLPGTINYPDERKRAKGRTAALAEVIYVADDTHPLSEFTKAPQVQAPTKRTNTQPATIDLTNVKRIESLDELPSTVPVQVRVMISLGYDPDDLTAGSFDKEGRSGPLWYVCCELVRQGVPGETIYSLITDQDWDISLSVIDGSNGDPDEYARRQIGRAKEYAIDPQLVDLNEEYALVTLGGKSRVMRHRTDGRVDYLQKDAFQDYWNKFSITVSSNGTPQPVPLGKWWLGHPQGRAYRDVIYAPGVEVEPDVFNLWQGFAFKPSEGDCSLYLEHLRENVCRGSEEHYDYLIRWMAYAVQNPGEPGHVAVVLKGAKGVGKGVFAKHFGRLWGRHAVTIVNPEHVLGFNSLIEEASVLFLDEAIVPKSKKHESILKALVTDPHVNVERKGVDVRVAPNVLHIIMASNDEWVVPASADERRFFFLHVGDDRRQEFGYFRDMEAQMEAGGYAALLKLLLELDLSQFEVRLAPRTEALQEQMVLSLDPRQEWLLTLLEEGVLPNNWSTPKDQLAANRAWVNESFEGGRNGLYDHARRSVPKLRDATEHSLGRFLTAEGIVCPEKGGSRSRVFPPLAELRRSWCARYGERPWPSGDDAEWVLVDDPICAPDPS